MPNQSLDSLYPIKIDSGDRRWQIIWAVFFSILLITSLTAAHSLGIVFGVLGLSAFGLGWAWNRLALRRIFYERNFSQNRFFYGDDIYLEIVLTNRKPVPLAWIKIEDDLPIGLATTDGELRRNLTSGIDSLQIASAAAWYERIRWKYELQVAGRGEYQVGPARVDSGDPFGFLRSQLTITKNDGLIVYPKVYPMEQLGILPARPLGDIRGGIEIFPDPSRPAGIRDYQVGDPLKTVDWKTTARVGKLMVKTFEPSSYHTVILAVAVDTAEPYWMSESPDDLERVISVAASMAIYIGDMEYSIGLYSNDMPLAPGRSMTIPPASEPEHLQNVLTSLALTRTFALGRMANELAEHSRKFPYGATIVLCAHLITEEMSETLRDLKRRGFRLTVLYTGEEELSGKLPEGIAFHPLREHIDRLEVEGGEIRPAETAPRSQHSEDTKILEKDQEEAIIGANQE